MKTSDVEKEIAARSGTAARNPVGESLVDANAKRVFKDVVSYRDTPIGATEGAKQSDPLRPLARQARRNEQMDEEDADAQSSDNEQEDDDEDEGRSFATDSSRSFGVCCGNLGGVKAHNAAHRKAQLV